MNEQQKVRFRNLTDLPEWLKELFPDYEFSAWYWGYGIDVSMFQGEDIIQQWSFSNVSQTEIFVELKTEVRKIIEARG